MPIYKKFICSFADSKMVGTSLRFRSQAVQMNFYDDIFIYNEYLLDDKFVTEFEQRLLLRGYGYWSWKPQIILQAFLKMNYGDILQYSDIGCHLSTEGVARLRHYFDIVDHSENDFLAFKMIGFPENKWTKGDVFDYFNFRDDMKIVSSPQFWAGSFFVKKTKKSEIIIREWMNIIKGDFNLIDDSESKSSNFPEFIEHRHDQSLFSLMAKKYHFMALEHGVENTKYYANYPILALRDKEDKSEWSAILAYPQICRGFIKERKNIKKIKILIEVILGQSTFLFIRSLFKMLKNKLNALLCAC